MTIEVREAYYYLIQGTEINPDSTLTFTDQRNFVISGFNASNPVNTSRLYAVEQYYYLVAGGLNSQPSLQLQQRTGYWVLEGISSSVLKIGIQGLWAITAIQPTSINVDRTCLFVITDGPIGSPPTP